MWQIALRGLASRAGNLALLVAIVAGLAGCARPPAREALPWRHAVALRVGVPGWWNAATLSDPALAMAVAHALAQARPTSCGRLPPALGGYTLTAVAADGRPVGASAVWQGQRRLWWNGCFFDVAGRDGWLLRGAVAAAREAWSGRLVPWTTVAADFPRGARATVTDWTSGRSFTVVRWGGRLHADVEPAAARDAAVLRAIYGGQWSWVRRPILVTLPDGLRVAASMNGMPHGGGAVSGNAFDGHFCLHFLGSEVHRSGRIDPAHLWAILAAAGVQVAPPAAASSLTARAASSCS